MSTPQSHYKINFRNAAGDPAVVIDIFSEIGDWWGYGLRNLAYDLHGKTEDIKARISSYGGDLLQGISIMQFLRSYPGNVTTEVIGVAASAATFVVQGGDKIVMNAGSFYMIHNPYTYSGGTADQLEGDAASLRKMQDEMIAIYAAGIRKRKKMADLSDEALNTQIQDWMNAETWFTADEALAYGFIDEISAGKEAAAASDTAIQNAGPAMAAAFTAYRNVPTQVLNLINPDMAKKIAPKDEKVSPLNALLKGLKNLLTTVEADATGDDKADAPEATATESDKADPIEAAKKTLADAGYTVTETEDEAEEEDESGEGENEETQPAKTYTEAEVQVMLKTATATAAKKATGKNPANKTTVAPASASSKADAIRASKVEAFDKLAAKIKK